ncbi:hypothetical protein GGI22_003806, partial [Coemansia erecta]
RARSAPGSGVRRWRDGAVWRRCVRRLCHQCGAASDGGGAVQERRARHRERLCDREHHCSACQGAALLLGQAARRQAASADVVQGAACVHGRGRGACDVRVSGAGAKRAARCSAAGQRPSGAEASCQGCRRGACGVQLCTGAGSGACRHHAKDHGVAGRFHEGGFVDVDSARTAAGAAVQGLHL